MMGFGLKMHTVAVKLSLADGVYYSDPLQLAQTSSRPPIQVLLGWVKSLRGKKNRKRTAAAPSCNQKLWPL